MIEGGRSRCSTAPTSTPTRSSPSSSSSGWSAPGFGEFLFYDWAKEPGWDLDPNPILATGRNFGCGSSREHAPWALEDYGFRAIVAPSLRRHLLLQLHQDRAAAGGARRGGGGGADGRPARPRSTWRRRWCASTAARSRFEIDPEIRRRLLGGLDDIGVTLQSARRDRRLRGRARAHRPRHHRAVSRRATGTPRSLRPRLRAAGGDGPGRCSTGSRSTGDETVLDAGCGSGRVTAAAARAPARAGAWWPWTPRRRWSSRRARRSASRARGAPGRPDRARARRAGGRRVLQRRLPLGRRPRRAVRAPARRAAARRAAGGPVRRRGQRGALPRAAPRGRRRAQPFAEHLARLDGALELRRRRGDRASACARAGLRGRRALARALAGGARASRSSTCARSASATTSSALPEELREPYVEAVAERCGEPLELDYVRLNIDARRRWRFVSAAIG